MEQCYAILLQTEEVLLLSYMFLCEFPHTFLGLLVVKRWLHVLIFASERRVCKFWFEQIFSMYVLSTSFSLFYFFLQKFHNGVFYFYFFIFLIFFSVYFLKSKIRSDDIRTKITKEDDQKFVIYMLIKLQSDILLI